MATPATTAADYCTLLVKSKLLPAAEVQSLYRKWKEEKPGDDSRVDSFRRFIVDRSAVTEYQAHLVQRGRAEGFFLGEYKILDRVGKGRMGGVYKAARGTGQIVALKILPASKAKDTHTLARFHREARLLTQLRHPNVVRAFEVGDSGGVHYIAMEYLEGETLDEVLSRRGRLPAAEAARLLCQALDGLQHLHDQRMVHRDVKPANLMLTPAAEAGKPDTWQATLKILDVGLGREMFDDTMPEGQVETQLTQEGAVVGTPDYLAPEQAKDARTADIRADIYSMGCVLYHCLTGRPPFTESSIMAQMVKHATETPQPLATFTTDLPPGLQNVMNHLLAKSPEGRYHTPAEAAAALRPFVGTKPTSGARPVPTSQSWLTSESQLGQTQVIPGTGARPALGATAMPARPVPGPALKSGAVPQPARPAAPVPAPPVPSVVYLPPPPVDEVEVELVEITEPPPEPAAAPAVPTQRPVWPPDRRDWLMLATGATSVLSAVGLGYAMARVLRRKEPDEEKK